MARTAARRGRILVVEDHPDLRETVADLLVDAGYTVDCAANGQEALAHLQAGPRPDLILLDLMMPVMNGWVFWEKQQQDPRLADIPVIVTSAVVDRQSSRDMLAAVVCLTKPVDIETLLALADHYCS